MLEAERRDREISRQLKMDEMRLKKEFKLLLLGAGESGKSTIVKQMRIIHGENYSEKERLEFRDVIFDNILRSMRAMLDAMDKVDPRCVLANPANAQNAAIVRSYDPSVRQNLDFQRYLPALKALWADQGIRDVFDLRRQYQLIDSTQ